MKTDIRLAEAIDEIRGSAAALRRSGKLNAMCFGSRVQYFDLSLARLTWGTRYSPLISALLSRTSSSMKMRYLPPCCLKKIRISIIVHCRTCLRFKYYYDSVVICCKSHPPIQSRFRIMSEQSRHRRLHQSKK
jgi:hypothetical protein